MRGFGWKRDPRDARDHAFSAPGPMVALPTRVSMRQHVREVLDQGQTSSCVAHAYAQAIAVLEHKAGLNLGPISRLYLYSMARGLTGDEREDAGTYLRSGARALQVCGAPPESVWSFRPENINQTPPIAAHMKAHPRRGGRYVRITGTGAARVLRCKQALATGQPFVFGTEIGESFMSMVGPHVIGRPSLDEPLVGGHALVCTGYDSEGFEICNSWSDGWRNEGFFTMTEDYMGSAFTSDLWATSGWHALQGGAS